MLNEEYATSRIWVFAGDNSRLTAGVFATIEDAEAAIGKHSLSGMVTAYPLGLLVYDWAIEMGLFIASKPHHESVGFIQGFTSAYLEHYHFVNGIRCD